MSKTTTTTTARPTVKGAYAEIAAVREEIAGVRNLVEDGFARIERLMAGGLLSAPTVEAPVLVATPVVGEVVATSDVTTGRPFRELREILKAHKASGAIKPGVTVRDAIAQGLMTDEGLLVGDGVPATVVAVVAETTAQAKARSEKQVEAAREQASGPRRANGSITPKAEWALREDLAMIGTANGFDKHEIDVLGPLFAEVKVLTDAGVPLHVAGRALLQRQNVNA